MKVDLLYEKDPKYDNDSEYEKDSEYDDKSSSDSENEDHGIVAMAIETHGFCFVSGTLPIEDFLEMPTRIYSLGFRCLTIT